jgi:hypothetical protein
MAIYEISGLSNLETLICDGCHGLQLIRDLPNLKELNCSMTGLINISHLDLLTKLDCNMCIKLEWIDTLPALSSLNCSHCTRLRKIECVPELNEIYSSGCSALLSLPIIKNRMITDKLSDEVCSICYDNENVFLSQCGHSFHQTCLNTWIERNSCCPYCRKNY